MALNDQEIKKINTLYTQLDAMTVKYNNALEDIHKLSAKITEYADALVVKKCNCDCNKTSRSTTKKK